MNFSTDAKQSCLYIGDNSNMTIYILNRDTLQELGRLGRSGRETGEFHWLHQVSVDSHGNIYTAEVDTGKRIQKFMRYGGDGCSGTGRTTVGGVLPSRREEGRGMRADGEQRDKARAFSSLIPHPSALISEPQSSSSEHAHRDLGRRGQQPLQLIIDFAERHRHPVHFERGAVLADVAAPHLDAARFSTCSWARP